MFGKKKEKKEKIKEERMREKAQKDTKEEKKKDGKKKAPSAPAESVHSSMNGYYPPPPTHYNNPPPPGHYNQHNGYARENMSDAVYVHKANPTIEQFDPAAGHKYGAKNLQLLESEKEKKKQKKDKGKDKDKENKSDKKSEKREGKSEKKSDSKKSESKDIKSSKKSDSKDKKSNSKDAKNKDKKDHKKSDKKDKKDEKKPERKMSDSKEPKGGILKKKKSAQGMALFDTHAPTAPPTSGSNGQVTFAGPDNRVHQSVVDISQPPQQLPDILPHNYQTNIPDPRLQNGGPSPMYNPAQFNGYPPSHGQFPGNASSPNLASPYGQPSPYGNPGQQQSYNGNYHGNHLAAPPSNVNGGVSPAAHDPRHIYQQSTPNLAFAGHQAVRHTNSDPNANMPQQIQHLTIPQGPGGTRHVASIDVPSLNRNGSMSAYPHGQKRSPSPAYGMASARGGLPHNKKHQAPNPPFIVADVNVPETALRSQREQYEKFDRMVEKARNDEITYAQLLFDQQKAATAAAKNTLRKDRIADLTVEMDSDEENAHPLRHRRKGILKAPKKVEFNKDVDVTLFGTMSRHESLESLYYGDPNVRGFVDPRQVAPQVVQQQPQHVVYGQYAPPPPSYVSVVHERPLDDTDLYMYTMRRKRAPHVYQWHDDMGHTARGLSRKGSLRASGRGSLRASGHRGSSRTVRVPHGAVPMW